MSRIKFTAVQNMTEKKMENAVRNYVDGHIWSSNCLLAARLGRAESWSADLLASINQIGK